MADKRGGYQPPAQENRKAVSSPRSGNRTDGGTADKVKARVTAGGAHGTRQVLEDQTTSEQMPDKVNTAGAPLTSGAPPQGQPPGGAPGGAFGPTQRPNEPITAGLPQSGPTREAPPAESVLRLIYEQYPSPWIRGLFE